MEPKRDELDDPPKPSECRCEGTGWIFVLEGYVRAHAKNLDDAPLTGALRNSVYPCKFHNPRRFHRWAEGHYAKDHDEAECDECRMARPRSSFTRRRKRAVPVETTRKDFE
jgi:hypothetical protein